MQVPWENRTDQREQRWLLLRTKRHDLLSPLAWAYRFSSTSFCARWKRKALTSRRRGELRGCGALGRATYVLVGASSLFFSLSLFLSVFSRTCGILPTSAAIRVFLRLTARCSCARATFSKNMLCGIKRGGGRREGNVFDLYFYELFYEWISVPLTLIINIFFFLSKSFSINIWAS